MEVPQETIDSQILNKDTVNVFNKLLDIESQAFSDRGTWCEGINGDSSFTSSLRSRTMALVERATIEDEPQFKSRRPIDMNIIERIKALRGNTVERLVGITVKRR